MRIAPLADVKARLSAYLDEAGTSGPIVITRNGKAVAVLVAPVDDDDLERMLLARSPRFRTLLNKSRQSIKAGKGLSRDKFGRPSGSNPASVEVKSFPNVTCRRNVQTSEVFTIQLAAPAINPIDDLARPARE
jgi:prevent-host-death family protein